MWDQSLPVSLAIAAVVDFHAPDIACSFEDTHPAWNEGFSAYYHSFWSSKMPYSLNPYESTTDAHYEWQDGYDTAHSQSMTYRRFNTYTESFT